MMTNKLPKILVAGALAIAFAVAAAPAQAGTSEADCQAGEYGAFGSSACQAAASRFLAAAEARYYGGMDYAFCFRDRDRWRCRAIDNAANPWGYVTDSRAVFYDHLFPMPYGVESCKQVSFKPNTDWAAWDIYVRGTSCRVARNVARHYRGVPRRWGCTRVFHPVGLDHEDWRCRRGSEVVVWALS